MTLLKTAVYASVINNERKEISAEADRIFGQLFSEKLFRLQLAFHMVEKVTNLPRFFESIFTGMGKAGYHRVYGVFEFNS